MGNDVVEACCLIQEDGNGGYVLKPRTGTDKFLLENFVSGEKGRIVNVRVMNRAQSKTYDQTKTFWGLLALYYRAVFQTHPTTRDLRWFYEELLPDIFPARPSLTKDGEFVPKHWSELTKAEGIEVISKIASLAGERVGVPEEIRSSVRDIFEWVQGERGKLYNDPTDFHEDGTPLTLAEWAEKNTICMCTGSWGGDICHIVSRGEGKGLEWLVNQPWNLYRARHDIHLGIQHGISWDAVFDGVPRMGYMGAPWLRGRYERARRLFDRGRYLFHNGTPMEDVIRILSQPEDEDAVKQETDKVSALAAQASEREGVLEEIF